MNLLPIADHLESAGLGKQSKTIFISQIPMECPNGILLRSPLAGTKINHELPGYFKTTFSAIVRSNSYATGEQLIESVSAAVTMAETQLGDTMYVRYIRPLTLPVVFPISKGSLLEFAVTFEIVFIV